MKLHTRKLPILNAFNRDHLAVLKRVNAEINNITPEIKSLARNMHYTLEQNKNGVGLAAPQIGVNKRMFIIQYYKCHMTVINPTILHYNDDIRIDTEGCLSVPGMGVQIPRSETIQVSYTDIKGKRIVDILLHMFLARVFQHEYDHLVGKLIINLSSEKGVVI